MPFTTDAWVSNHSPKIALKLHAMGVVTLEWNMCEAALLSFFFDLVALPPEEAWVLFSDLGDIAISERIRSLLKAKSAPPEAVAAIDNILQFYENCRLNRNQLTHFEVDKLSAGEYLLRRKSKKRDVPLGEEFSNKLEDIRAVADDIKVLPTDYGLLPSCWRSMG
jgi:hypothetical protein